MFQPYSPAELQVVHWKTSLSAASKPDSLASNTSVKETEHRWTLLWQNHRRAVQSMLGDDTEELSGKDTHLKKTAFVWLLSAQDHS